MGHPTGLGLVARIECRLSATGLARIEIDGASCPTQQLYRRYPDLGRDGVHETGNEEGDLQAARKVRRGMVLMGSMIALPIRLTSVFVSRVRLRRP